MDQPPRKPLKAGGRADIAFALMVMAAYFATFTSIKEASFSNISLMIGGGVAYVTIGIYGYAYCSQAKQKWLPLIYFAVQISLGGWIIYMGKGAGFNAMVLLPLAGQSVMLLPQFQMYGINVGIASIYILAVYAYTQNWDTVWETLQILLAAQVFIVAFTQMAVNEEKARIEVEHLANDLSEANQHLREYAMAIEELAISKERNRLAREIHDGLGHYLTTIHMQIQAAKAVMLTQPERSQQALDTAQKMTHEALADVRRSVAALRAPLEEELPLPDQLHDLLKSYEGTGLQPDIKVIGSPHSLPPQVQLTLYRAVQEGLNNTSKHAQATQIWITLDYSVPQKVYLMVCDNGLGKNAERGNGGGFGLMGLQERAHLLKGEFRVLESQTGFTFEMILPG